MVVSFQESLQAKVWCANSLDLAQSSCKPEIRLLLQGGWRLMRLLGKKKRVIISFQYFPSFVSAADRLSRGVIG